MGKKLIAYLVALVLDIGLILLVKPAVGGIFILILFSLMIAYAINNSIFKKKEEKDA